MPVAKCIPFGLDRSCKTSLGDQLVVALRDAIHNGFYISGDVLPSKEALARELGVSEIVVRTAYRTLAAEGLVMARPRIGTVVLPKQTPVWRGHVLCVMSDHDFNFRLSTVVEIIRDRLTREGFLFSQVSALRDRNWKLDFTALDYSMRRSIDFMVLVFGDNEIEEHLSSSGIPYAVVGGAWNERSGCVGRIACSSKRAVSDFVRHCKCEQVRNISLVYCNRKDATAISVQEALTSVGISVSEVRVAAAVDSCRLENVVRAGDMAGRRIFFNGSNRKTPDLVFVTDDFLAVGVLASASRLGVRIPEDVRFACIANAGKRPYSRKPISCLSFDAAACGRMVAESLIGYLKLRRPLPSRAFESVCQTM